MEGGGPLPLSNPRPLVLGRAAHQPLDYFSSGRNEGSLLGQTGWALSSCGTHPELANSARWDGSTNGPFN
ncbi:unnamed protein product [Linum trigynum]|uniref:Uncharacterized protein n=1 Tax=Linum trigynum TaxID=586398 RepID=A0AAV2EY00_9ROSI